MKTDGMNNLKYQNVEAVNWNKEFPEMPDCVRSAIDNATGQILAKKSTKVKHFPKKRILLLAAVITLLSGMTVAAASLWQQRMEAMNRQEVEAYFLAIEASNAPAFRYNRAMTEAERAAFTELTVQYEQEGAFPKGVLTMLDSVDEYKGKGVGYDGKSGTFFLPEEEMNTEELLQIVDFYHKAEYAIIHMNENVSSEKREELVKAEKEQQEALSGGETGANTGTGQGTGEGVSAFEKLTYAPLNDEVSYCELSIQGEENINDIAVGKEYLYIAFRTHIKRMVLGTDVMEDFYELKENESVFAINSDDSENVYLSLMEYDAASEHYTNKLIRIDVNGNVAAEYDLIGTAYQDGKNLEDLTVRNMLADENGLLYVKGGWNKNAAVFIFDAEGNFVDKITSDEYGAHVSNEMCFGQDGYLYLLAVEQLLKIDLDTREIVEAYHYEAEEMAAMVNLIHSLDEKSFYILSYDGLFRYTLGEVGSTRFLAPYESGVFAEGFRHTPISEDKMVIVNATDYESYKYRITFLSFEK